MDKVQALYSSSLKKSTGKKITKLYFEFAKHTDTIIFAFMKT